VVPFAKGGENDSPDISIQHILNSRVNETSKDATQGYSNGIASTLSPMGMDLGEFMLEGDIEFMNQLVSMGQIMGNGSSLNRQQNMENLGASESTGV
jgi:hypothetical protein